MDVPSLQRGKPRHKGREDGLGRSMRTLSPYLPTPTPSGKARAALWSRPSGSVGRLGRQSLSRQRLKGIGGGAGRGRFHI